MHLRLTEGLTMLEHHQQPFVKLFEHGTLVVELYAPQQRDLQTPHTRDELYVVANGTGWFVNGDQRHPFGPKDVLFVPAGVVHRFEDFSEDFAVWVMFYGPEGGESATPPLHLRLVSNESEWQSVKHIRTEVFILEQACPPEEEWDLFDDTATHILGTVNGVPAACARWRITKSGDGDGLAKLERFAILAPFRGKGYGRQIVEWTIDQAEKAGYLIQMIHAQAHLQFFYNSLGFRPIGKLFDEAGIPHIRMFRKGSRA
ncbi:MAG TPA: GNAT family N-acetyltransferase [Rhodothermales bacterium]|nr:GNAT family N-acetyltransferase [Rhodothermales bacterium]